MSMIFRVCMCERERGGYKERKGTKNADTCERLLYLSIIQMFISFKCWFVVLLFCFLINS